MAGTGRHIGDPATIRSGMGEIFLLSVDFAFCESDAAVDAVGF